MRSFLGLLWLEAWLQLSRSRCVLEKEYFCSSIPDGFPEGMTSIVFVVTNLGVINSTVFRSPALGSVTSLALANSGITEIEPGAFRVFQSLTKLSLYQNSLTHFSGSWLPNPGLLENLTLAQNFLSRIGRHTFSGFSNLTTLSLANNQIRQIARGSFTDLPKLKWLSLSGNNLTVLTRSAFEGLATPPAMQLGSNPWNCSCELQDLVLFLHELINSSLLDDASSVVCYSPPNLEGIHLWNISDFNCPPDFLSLRLENSFYNAGLPALLASLAVFIAVLACLCRIRMSKREKKQICPKKEAVESTTNAKPNEQEDPTAEGQQTDGKTRTSEGCVVSHTRRQKVRARSASAILLRTEFRRAKWGAMNLVETTWEHLAVPYVSMNNKLPGGRNEDLNNLMERWNFQNSEESYGKHSQRPDKTGSVPGEGSVEVSRVRVLPEPVTAFLQDNGILEAPEKDHANGRCSVENPEPLLYLTVTRAPRQPPDTKLQEDMMTQADKSPTVSLKRALTWPYERRIGGQRSDMLSERGALKLPSHRNETEKPKEENGAEWLCMAPKRKDQLPSDGRHELSGEVKFLDGKDSLHPKERQVTVGEATDVGEDTFEKGKPRRHGRLGCNDQGGTQINMEPNPSWPPEVMIQRESSVAAVPRCVQPSPPGIKPTRHLSSVKAKQGPKPIFSQSRAPLKVPPSPMLSAGISATSSAYNDQTSLECYEHDYMNLLHEVVENRGRWTRERWKQTHRNCGLRKSK